MKGPFYHGGAPGLQTRSRVSSAAARNMRYTYHTPGAKYSPHFIYLTTSIDLAKHFASKYTNNNGYRVAGSVYEVQPSGAIEQDPDYGVDEVVRCRSGIVLRVMASNVRLTELESFAAQKSFMSWGPGRPMYDADDFMLPSGDMEDCGVTPAYLRLFPKMLRHDQISATGKALLDGKATNEALFKLVASLDSGHAVELAPKRRFLFWGGRRTRWKCTVCTKSGTTALTAACHQLGEEVLRTLNPSYQFFPTGGSQTSDDISDHLRAVIAFARERNPSRWRVLSEL